ncbi:ABC transporter ATP-binding protein [Candidatus Omnitrophota bacterium]
MNYIEIERLSKDFTPPLSFHKLLRLKLRHRKPTRALEDISFSLKKGEILGILGPNGAGKTTLLKIISTLILPDKGTATVKGYRIGRDDQEIKSLIGLVSPAERSFYWRLSGRQNLEFFAAMYGLNKKESNARIRELLSVFHIDYPELDKRFDSYSTGIKQKFALIRALLNNPELVLFDEPTKSLDYKTSSDFRNFIKEDLIKHRGKTVIFTTHHMDEAMDFGGRFLILHRGNALALGTLEEFRSKISNPAAGLGEIFLELTKNQ